MRARRVIVGLDAAAPMTRAAIETAARLAGRMEAELVGLFVENVELIHLAALPFTREVGFPSAASREIDVERMERHLRSVAAQARRMLESAAADPPLRWSFRVTRGALTSELIAALAEADLVLACAGAPGRAPAPPAIRVVSARDPGEFRAALADRRGGIVILTGAADRAVDAALDELVRPPAGKDGR